VSTINQLSHSPNTDGPERTQFAADYKFPRPSCWALQLDFMSQR